MTTDPESAGPPKRLPDDSTESESAEHEPSHHRRAVLGAIVAGGLALAGCSSDDSTTDNQQRVPSGQSESTTEPRSGESWMAGVENYNGYAVRTDADSVTVAVGAEGNGGTHAFDPPAVLISPGTRLRWEWRGDGQHGVAERTGVFQSEVTASQSHTFEHRFEQVGVYRYGCPTHRDVGMRGVVTVTRS